MMATMMAATATSFSVVVNLRFSSVSGSGSPVLGSASGSIVFLVERPLLRVGFSTLGRSS